MWGLPEQLWCQIAIEKLFLSQLVNNYPSMEHGCLKCLVFDLLQDWLGKLT
jgi:hypothetical protein